MLWGPAWAPGGLGRLVTMPDGTVVAETYWDDRWLVDERSLTATDLLRWGLPATVEELEAAGLNSSEPADKAVAIVGC